MKTFLHLLRWELAAEGRIFFAAALLVGLLPYALAPIAAETPADTATARVVIARVLVVLFLLGASLFFGGRWLTAGFGRRRSFELARPVSAWSLSSSKLAANAVLIFGGTWLASLPTGMAALQIDRGVFETFLPRFLRKDPEAYWRTYTVLAGIAEGTDPAWLVSLKTLLFAAITALLVFFAAQVVALAAVHPGWTSLADLGAWLFFVAKLGLAFLGFVMLDATGQGLAWLTRLGVGVIGLGVLAAWQSFEAGPLSGFAHRRHALVFNLGLVALAYLGSFLIRAELRPDPDRLETFSVAVPSADFSRWVLAGTSRAGRLEPVFVVDPAKRGAIFLGYRSWIPDQPWLSRDGRRVFFDSHGHLGTYELDESAVVGWGGGTIPTDKRFYQAFNETRDLEVMSLPGALLAQRLVGRKWLAAGRAESPDLQGQPSYVVHRQGPKFDLLVHCWGGEYPDSRMTVRRLSFDADTGELSARETWTYPPGLLPLGPVDLDWWREALPLLDAGADFAELKSYRGLFALPQGRGLRQAGPADPDPGQNLEWIYFDARNPRLGSFKTPAGFEPIGEIRPGLLLMGKDQGSPAGYDAWLAAIRENPEPLLHTLVVDLPSGRIVRRLDGYLPVTHFAAGGRIWLIDRNLVPYDLDSAAAEPRPLLPWRPRRAAAL